jgi:hypothetical protein
LIIVSAINAALWERRPAAIISDMLCKHRGETPLSQWWMAETMIKAGFYMRWSCLKNPLTFPPLWFKKLMVQSFQSPNPFIS